MLIAHLSDLHLRDADDVVWLDLQLDRIVARGVDHLAITGDLLDRWNPGLLERVLDTLDSRLLLSADRLTILHGNHDLASSGGHPRRGSDLWRLALRLWDPPPLLRWRRRRFYDAIARRCGPASAGPCLVAHRAPFAKTLPSFVRIAVLDTVPFSWTPLSVRAGAVSLHHAIGRIAATEADWLEDQSGGAGPLIVLMHHLPLDAPGFTWRLDAPWTTRLPEVRVPMHIPGDERARFWRAAARAAVRLVLCGHVHRARLDWHGGIAVGLNGQSGAAWAGRPVAYYDVGSERITMTLDKA